MGAHTRSAGGSKAGRLNLEVHKDLVQQGLPWNQALRESDPGGRGWPPGRGRARAGRTQAGTRARATPHFVVR